MRSLTVGGLAVIVGIAMGCSGERDRLRGGGASGQQQTVPPEVPDVSGLDVDGDHLDDLFKVQAAKAGVVDDVVTVEAIFRGPVGVAEVDAFVRAGGSVRHVFRHVSYGFTGRIARSKVNEAASALGSGLLLLKADRFVELHLDEATRTGRVRPVWAPSFGGGYNGSSTINIAIMDGGVDLSHPDLAGRSVGWKDYTSEALPAAADQRGHGTHVAGIALGSGVSFGVGPGTLKITESGDLTGFVTSDWVRNTMHLPLGAFDVSTTATWVGGGSTSLALRKAAAGDGSISQTYDTLATVTGSSPLTLNYAATGAPNQRYSFSLLQNAASELKKFAIRSTITNYPAVGDGFPALRGVASASHWYGARVFPSVGVATTADIAEAMDDLVALRISNNIKVVNMSFSVTGGAADLTQRAKANTMVANGMVVVVSAGNNGASATIGDPGRAANVITVGASNEVNALTQYTSAGFNPTTADVDLKPDLIAPGGSLYYSKIISADTNSSEADDATFNDGQANDYSSNMGTSMAAPFVSGSATLLIEALEKSGTAWGFTSTASPFLVKLLLLASSTETNKTREHLSDPLAFGNPPLGRAAQQKDTFEGYGMINPDAAIEAATITYDFNAFTASTTGATTDRRAWGRKINVPAGKTLKLALDVPDTGDFDLYVYESTPDAKGNPVLLTWSDKAGLGVDEVLTWRFLVPTTLYAFVKRVSGNGAFTLTGFTFTCGNGVLEPGKQCDDGNDLNGDCCNVACQFEPTTQACNDNNACTQQDRCNGAGKCVGQNPVFCPALDACHDVGTCAPATGLCSNPNKTNGSPCNDNDKCTQTDACQNGVCVGTNQVQCGSTASCGVGGSCDPISGLCSLAAKPDGTACNDSNLCTGNDACQAGLCVGTNPKVCNAPDECHIAACSPIDATCLTSKKPDGTPCTNGFCLDGTCNQLPVDGGVDAGNDAAAPEAGVDDARPPDAAAPARRDGGAIDDDDEYTGVNDNGEIKGGGCSCGTGGTSSPTSKTAAAMTALALILSRARRTKYRYRRSS